MDALLIILIVGISIIMLGISFYLLVVYVHRKEVLIRSR